MNHRVPSMDNAEQLAEFKRFEEIDRRTRLNYLIELLAELRTQALSLNENTLAYLIEMSVLEATHLNEVEKFPPEIPAD